MVDLGSELTNCHLCHVLIFKARPDSKCEEIDFTSQREEMLSHLVKAQVQGGVKNQRHFTIHLAYFQTIHYIYVNIHIYVCEDFLLLYFFFPPL